MERAHDGMTFAQQRMLAFWLDVHGWQDWYVELNGELPMPGHQPDDELDDQDRDDRIDVIRAADRLLDPPPEEE
jgi:hypothetical protein